MPAAVASRYARALADLVTKPGSAAGPARVLSELEAFQGALTASPALRHVLLAPSAPPPRKRALIARLAASLELSDLVRKFLCVLVDHRRIPLLAEVREEFETEMDRRGGLVRVDVASAGELGPARHEALSEALARLTGRRARVRFRLQPELIGGLVARVGSTVYDGSVRGRLEALRRRLAGTEH